MVTRIALLFEYPTLNGGERSMLQTLELVDPGEFEVVALAPASGRLAAALRQQSVQHVLVRLRDGQGARLPRDEVCECLVESIQRVPPQLVHANSLSMGRLSGAVAERLEIPCVAHLRDIIGLSKPAIVDLNRNRALIAVSDATRRFHIAQGLNADRISVIHNGVDCNRFQPRPRTGELCRELNVPPTSFILLTVGQIGLRKGQDVLAAAAPAIVREVPAVQFVIVGQRDSAKAETIAYEQEVVAQFARAGLSNRLHLLGYREEIAQLMSEADLLVHPAKQEPLGRVLLEAAAAGLPIVATAVGGTEEIVADGESARLVSPNDAAALSRAICDLASNEALRQRFAKAARCRVATDFTPQAAASNLMAVWRRCIGQASTDP
jgi:glycosyltransferase involved in cell wall biosynthesis